jgi:hypothetical protein
MVLLPKVQEIAARSVSWVRQHDAEYTAIVTETELMAASRLCAELVLGRVAGFSLHDEVEQLPETLGRTRATQGAPLEAVLRTLRIDYRVVWEAMLHLGAHEETIDLLELLTDGAARMWDVIDDISVRLAAAYRETEREIHMYSEERARLLIADLIRGTGPTGVIAAEAASRTGLPVNGRFVVCCAQPLSTVFSSDAPKRALARQGFRSAWHSEVDNHIGIIEVGTLSIESVIAILRPIDDVRIGISPVAEGLAGVRELVWLAEAAVKSLPHGLPGLASLEHHFLEGFVANAYDLASVLYQQFEDSLSKLRPAERERVMTTVSAYVNGSGSLADTASHLHYHRNTIINHIRQFEQCTGRSLHKPRDLAEVLIAFGAARLRGSTTAAGIDGKVNGPLNRSGASRTDATQAARARR